MVWGGRSAPKACRDGVTSVLTCGGSWTHGSAADAERMSQDDDAEANRVVLETFSSWSREDCRRELPSALPRLLISLEDAGGRGPGRGKPSPAFPRRAACGRARTLFLYRVAVEGARPTVGAGPRSVWDGRTIATGTSEDDWRSSCLSLSLRFSMGRVGCRVGEDARPERHGPALALGCLKCEK